MGGGVNSSTTQKFEAKEEEDLELIKSGLKVCILSEYGSTSLLEKKLSIGYMKASRLMDKLIELGYISKTTNAQQKRSVLVSEEEFEEIFGEPL